MKKLITSEFHQNFTGRSPTSPPSYSVGIFQISQPPSPPQIHKGGGVGGFLDPKTDHHRISRKVHWTFSHISPIIFRWNFFNISTPLPPTNSQRGWGRSVFEP